MDRELSLIEKWDAMFTGEYTRCELVLNVGGEVRRSTIGRFIPGVQEDDSVRIFRARFKKPQQWSFLLIPTTPDELRAICKCVMDMVGQYTFSEERMIRSGLAHNFFLGWFIRRPYEPLPPNAKPLYCAEYVILVLQSAGMLKGVPPDLTTASDLWILCLLHLEAITSCDPTYDIVLVDSLGLRLALSMEDV